MPRTVRLRELLVGVEGLALLRHMYDGDDRDAEQRLTEVRALLDDDAFAEGELTSEAQITTGYRAWAPSYDEVDNPLIALEEPAVRSLIDTLPPGPALDAACGTGRHARHLVASGHDVVGFDLTPEMLDVARTAVPEAEFVEGDLTHIPAEDARFALVVCGLALAHVADLDTAVRELARVLQPGGRLVISALHPFQVLLGWHAPFADDEGARHFVREYSHTHADYLAAFRAAGLRLVNCLEPALTAPEVAAKRRAFDNIPDAALAAYVGLPAVLVWDVEKT
jgi:ubiquinone/menaquinone biosynthesis C-methylase UbiE